MTKNEALRLAIESLCCVRDMVGHPDNLEYIDHQVAKIEAALEAKDEPVGKLQKPTGERAWFTIFELNAWADKKLSENPHWVMPKDEPERDDPPPQRTWVGLTDEEIQKALGVTPESSNWNMIMVLEWAKKIEVAILEKNNA